MQEMKETQVQSLGLEDPLEKGMTTHSNILARMDRGAWWGTVYTVTEIQARQATYHIRVHTGLFSTLSLSISLMFS